MLIVISPAKSLDFTTPLPTSAYSTPAFLTHAEVLIKILRKKSPAEIASLMSLSDALASLNVARYAEWSLPFSPDNARPAVFAFNGDVYEGLAATSLTEPALAFAQAHLRILSGLYGLLRPLDLIQAYRLEMGTRLKNRRGETLYDFWGDLITQALADEVRCRAEQGEASVLVNLASEEYFKSVRPKKLAARVVTPVFEDGKGGVYKQISFYAKRARGLMSRYAVSHALTEVEDLKAFDVEGYAFCPAASAGDRWVFRRNLVEK
ncbi:MAG: peroxide stress protein YaaA [Uliginosibacterium sp.]|nr:peroxide stress protein YaaA [Uliginosibacterium sp.]